jgi:hypothetical protein
MTNGNAASIPASSADGQNPGPQDDDTVVTPTRRAKASAPDGQLEEKTLRFRFPTMADGNNVIPPVLHYHFIAAVQEAFGDQIEILDNKNCRVEKIDMIRFDLKSQKNTFTWYGSSASIKQRDMNPSAPSVNPNDRRTVKYVSHRIRTTCSMADIKANPRVRNLLIDHNFFVNFHRWDETE